MSRYPKYNTPKSQVFLHTPLWKVCVCIFCSVNDTAAHWVIPARNQGDLSAAQQFYPPNLLRSPLSPLHPGCALTPCTQDRAETRGQNEQSKCLESLISLIFYFSVQILQSMEEGGAGGGGLLACMAFVESGAIPCRPSLPDHLAQWTASNKVKTPPSYILRRQFSSSSVHRRDLTARQLSKHLFQLRLILSLRRV